MPQLHAWFCRLLGLFHKKSRDAEMVEEMQQHLDLLTERNIAAGMSPNEARTAALRQFGSIEQIKETAREERVWMWADELLRDVCFGARMLVKAPGFTAVAILTLALGIGSNAAIFSVIDSVLLKPLPYPNADRLVVFREHVRRSGYEHDQEAVTPGDFSDWSKHNTTFAEMAGIAPHSFTLTGAGQPVQIEGEAVSVNLFSLLQVEPFIGRAFHPEEAQYGAGRVAILGYGLWATRFASDPQVVGRSILLDGSTYLVVGVMPKNFRFPDPDDQLWVPLALSPQEMASRSVNSLRVVGRLKANASLAQAQSEMDTITQELGREYPSTNSGLSASLISLRDQTVGNVRSALIVVWVCSVLVLLIVCANLATLLLARAFIRRREFAVRLALGASRARIVRQLITEGLLLSSLGGMGGLLFAVWGMHALRVISPPPSFPYIPRIDEIGIDSSLLVFLLCLSLAAGMLFSIIPALKIADCDIQARLKTQDARANSGGNRQWVRPLLVLIQTTLAVIVMVGAGLLLNSFVRLERLPQGFQSKNVLTLRVIPRGDRYGNFAERVVFYQQILSKIQNVPGVESAGGVSFLPLTRTQLFNHFSIEGQPVVSSSLAPSADVRATTPGYLAAMKIALSAGRDFSWGDTPESTPVVIVNKKFARDFFGNANVIGARLKLPATAVNSWRTIVGIAEDVSYFNPASAVEPTIYVPYAQADGLHVDLHDLAIRSNQRPESIAAAVRNAIWSVDSNLAVSRVRTMDEVSAISIAPQRFNLLLLALMAALVLILAVVGLYGVTAYTVTQRTREIGVRLALGAAPTDVMRLILIRTGVLMLGGICVGLVLSVSVAFLMKNLLFHVSPLDPMTYILVAGVLLLAGLSACYQPTRSAMRIDPITVLRHE
jgi:predicted permease